MFRVCLLFVYVSFVGLLVCQVAGDRGCLIKQRPVFE